ncbi:MAG: protein kinase [Planctomycetaceae bacterium]
MSGQFDSLKREVERRLGNGEITIEEYRFQMKQLAAASASPMPVAPVPSEELFVSQGDWQTFTGEPDDDSVVAAPFPPDVAPQRAHPGREFAAAGGTAMPPTGLRPETPHSDESTHRGAPPVRPAGQQLVGVSIGKFRFEHRVARGGMGEIWKAYDTIGERNVAIKVLPQELKHRDDEMLRVKTAFKRVQVLHHQNICPLYDLDWDDRLGYFLVMKFLDAVNLNVYHARYVERFDEMPVAEVARVLRPVAAALDYSHGQGIIHRDIKPQNVMVTADGKEVHVVDFDLAAEVRGTVGRAELPSETISGTFSYMSPEQWKGAALDGRADQYALAMIAYEMLAGRLPFDSPDPGVLRHCVLQDDVPMIHHLADEPQRAVFRALSKGPGDRFDNCTAFIDALEGKVAALSGAGKRTAPPPPPLRQSGGPASNASPASGGIAVPKFKQGSGSSRRERSAVGAPPVGAPQVRDDARPIREAIARQRGVPAGSITDQHLAGIKVLSLAGTPLPSLKPIAKCLGLEDLDVSGTPVADLTPLMALGQLGRLNLRGTRVTNLVALRSLGRLAALNLDDSPVEDLTPLRRIESLRTLTVQNTKVQDVSAVGFLMKLEDLDLTGTWIQDARPLAMLKQLLTLSLSRTLVVSVEPLVELAALKSLLLTGLSVVDLAPLAELTGLERLSLRGTRLRGLEIIRSMSRLMRLSVAGTEVVDFSPLANLPEIQQIDLESTKIRDLSSLSGLSNLNWVSLKGTRVRDLRPLHELSKLKFVDLTDTPVAMSDVVQLRAIHPKARIHDAQGAR